LPFNSGIAVGRNELVRAATEELVLISDDDIVPENADTIVKLKAVLDSDPQIGLVAPVLQLENGAWFGNEHYSKGLHFEFRGPRLVRLPAQSNMLKTSDINYRIVDQVPNFFLARRDIFADVQWDDRIKVEYEHLDYFIRLNRTPWKVAICLDAKAIHLRSEPEPEYNQFRRSSSPVYFLQKHGLSGVTNQF